MKMKFNDDENESGQNFHSSNLEATAETMRAVT